MKTQTWTTQDKSAWGPGPWQDEPDKLQWADETTGLPCLIKRNYGGALCGYVGVPEGHPWYGQDYDEVDPHPSVHGGLTYASHCQKGDEAETICHVPAPGEPDNVWWLGFDCAHYNDLSPGFAAEVAGLGLSAFRDRAYRTAAYVQAECADLAKQIEEARS